MSYLLISCETLCTVSNLRSFDTTELEKHLWPWLLLTFSKCSTGRLTTFWKTVNFLLFKKKHTGFEFSVCAMPCIMKFESLLQFLCSPFYSLGNIRGENQSLWLYLGSESDMRFISLTIFIALQILTNYNYFKPKIWISLLVKRQVDVTWVHFSGFPID